MPSVTPETLKPTMLHRVSMISKIKPTIYRTPHQHLTSNLKIPLLHSFEENKLEYEDEDEVEIKMMGTGMDKESLEHNLYEDNITLIICYNFSPTSNPPIKPKDSAISAGHSIHVSRFRGLTYTSVSLSEARSWSIPSEDPYEEAAQQLFEQAPRYPEYAPEDHIPVYIPEPEHPEDLLPVEDEAPIPPLSPSFLAPRIRPLSPRALEAEMRDIASSFYHSLHPSGTPPLLPIPLPAPSTSRRADIPEADTPPRKRLLLTTPRPGCEIGESSAAAAARQPGPTMAHRVDHSHVDTMETRSSEFCNTTSRCPRQDRAAVRAEDLEARVTVLETEVHRHEWQRQAADDLAVQYIMRTQALEAGARVDTLEDTGSSS
ncbi:hypothetical protein Tco_0015043 [Tanacetum coccineum]